MTAPVPDPTPDPLADLQARAAWHRGMAELTERVSAMVADLRVTLAPHDIEVSVDMDAGGATITFDCPSPPWDQAHVLGQARVEPDALPRFLQPQAVPPVVDLAARRAASVAHVKDTVRKVTATAEAAQAAAIEGAAAADRRALIEDLIARLAGLPKRPKWSPERDYQLLDALVHGTGLGDIAAYLRVPVGSVHERAADMARLADSLGKTHAADLDLRDAARIRAERARA